MASDWRKSATLLKMRQPDAAGRSRPNVATPEVWEEGSEMTKIVNLTPHPIALLAEDKAGDTAGSVGFGRGARPGQFRLVAELPSEGVARAYPSTETVGEVEVAGEKFPVTRTTFGSPEGMPEPDEESVYVLSLITAQAAAAAGRSTDDLLIVGETVRDDKGVIIGCTGFGRL